MSPKYPAAPIREAVCEFRFRLAGSLDIAIPGLVFNILRDEFPDRVESPVNVGQLNISVSSFRGGDTPLDPSEAGMAETMGIGQDLRFWRKDSKDGVIVVGHNRLAISHHAPYRSWEKFQPDIIQALNAYDHEAKPAGIQRVGLRYINDISFGKSSLDLEDYLSYYPTLGESLPSTYVGLHMSVQLPFEEHKDMLRLQLVSLPPGENSEVRVRLDLDYYLAASAEFSPTEVPDWLELAHQHIADTFEGCVTDKLRSIFNEVPS